MATVNEKMTALANGIRELSGTTDTKSLDEMKVDVDAANTEIAEQTELIAQITTALEGKASGVEDIDEEVVEYTSLNTELEAVINSLPDAGGGSGGTSVETCTVKITCSTSDIYGYFYTKVVDGNYSMGYFTNKGDRSNLDVTLTDVLCGGFIAVQANIVINFISVAISGDATYEVIPMTSSVLPIVAITAPTSPGSYSEVTIINND